MAELDPHERTLTIKVVYDGPPMSGKTTNIRQLYARAEPSARGRLLSLDTRSDRTLLFDLLPLHARAAGATVRLRVYTVPGQVVHRATRKVVLTGADGVIFVADSQRDQAASNREAMGDLRQNLRDLGVELEQLPIVVQFNKRDLAPARPDEDLAAMGRQLARDSDRPRSVLTATALHDEGVVPTFLALVELIWADLERKHSLSTTLGINPEAALERIRAVFEKQS